MCRASPSSVVLIVRSGRHGLPAFPVSKRGGDQESSLVKLSASLRGRFQQAVGWTKAARPPGRDVSRFFLSRYKAGAGGTLRAAGKFAGQSFSCRATTEHEHLTKR
ncbi:hypothetical protein CSUI_010537 [Cystoisospora suis]|uniref:Uncharacterized protein n=1 Tax=Cystoisospora suis TaxID=483139 RepID=A0A2C6JXF3_9APIC|nr:hypothetical protein CSUI_010537 [Cystoisospora suis]